jgi:hypothetical protein
MAWDPTQLTNVVAVWRADKGVTGNPNVTAWLDQTTNAYSLTGVSNPQYSATSFNSNPGITFTVSAHNYFTVSPFTFNTSALSIWTLFTVTTNNTNGGRPFSMQSGTGDDYTAPSWSGQVSMTAGNPAGSGYDNIGTAGVTPSGLNTPQLMGGICDGTHGWLYLNNATAQNQSNTSQTDGSATPATNQVGVGCQYNGNANVQFDGTIAMIVLTSSAMSTTDISNLISFVNSTWGTTFAGGGITFTATALATSSPTFGLPTAYQFSPLTLGNNALDYGVRRFNTNANGLYLCSTNPTTYAQATTTYALGSASVAAGTLFGAPGAGSPTGRIVTSSLVTGTTTANGTPICWAVVDSVNSDLLAIGQATGFTPVVSGQTWQLAPFNIHYSNV